MSFTGSNIALRAALAFACLLFLALLAYLLAGYVSANPIVLAGLTLEAGLLLGAVYIAMMGIVDTAVRAKAHKDVVTSLERMAAGDYSVRLVPSLGMSAGLAEAFNHMAEKFESEIKALTSDVYQGLEKKAETLHLQEQRGRLEEELIKSNSDLLRKEVMLEEVNQELLAASRVKSEFITNMGRELRTPLNSLIGLADFICSGTLGQLNDRQTQYVQDIKSSAKNLLDIVENILEYTMLDMGGALNCEEVRVKTLALDVVKSLGPMAAGHEVTLDCDVPDEGIWADGRKLRFVLYDLLQNAIKFNKPGGRAGIRARLTDGDERTYSYVEGGEVSHIEFTVEDTGVGFPPSEAYRLFRPFSQLSEAVRAKPKGAGLALALVKRYVELHNGKVWAESRPGSGSSFSFILPLAKGRPQRKVKKVLVVEDDPDQSLLITHYFDGEPYELLHADNGLDALRVVVEDKPDLVLLDVLLPKMDGIEVCKALKKQDRYEQFRHIPIIIFTSLADLGSKVKGVQAGADDFLIKPVDRKLLIERVRSLLDVKDDYEKVLASYRDAERDSISDPLTGLFNRRYMEDMLVKEFRNAERYKKNLSVLMVDIDFFKDYNDRHGHQEGDQLLKKLADVFRGAVREVDVAARYGGEEFLIILPETPSDMAVVAAERIRHAAETDTVATVSIGIATYPEDAGSKEILVEKADHALYSAKNSGRNRTVKYTPESGEPAPAITE